ncbi:MAG: histidinol dehydrogenase [Promethearchaeota archaeon]|nr:MAG: histidinol dehydrogenase [Candidatus Lokiarchaeota archaeon]
MIKILKNEKEIASFLETISRRGQYDQEVIEERVRKIIDDVKNNGNKACLNYTEKFDKIKLNKSEILVSNSEIEEAYNNVNKNVLEAIKKAIKNIEKFHKIQIEKIDPIETVEGVAVGQLIVPYDAVGIYIPGGRAPYPSTVLMTAIPAKIAGVNKIIMTTPPNKDKKINPAVLVAAKESKVDKIFKIGGAQAIAALTFGTESIPKVNKIVGPGNIYVNTAKMLLNKDVAIDLPAGPSEILIIADKNSNAQFVADDLLSQAEHDPDTYIFLLTTSNELIERVNNIISNNIESYSRKDIIKSSIKKNCYFIYAEKIEDLFEISNKIAPEHLEIQLMDPIQYKPLIKNAGAVFFGDYSPVPIGDYAAGSNHVLPTGGLAKFYSGLSTRDFVKYIDTVSSTKKGLENLKDIVTTLCDVEGFDGHKRTILRRLEE